MILSILAVILGLGTIIGIHEASHMFVSKLFGVKVLKFSLGFGPVLLSKKIGGTSYQLAALPLGGYVQMAGDSPNSNVKNGFFSLPWYKRSLIALAGPVANLILGFVTILALLMLFKGWPFIAGVQKTYSLTSFVIVTTLKWLFGIHSTVKDVTQGGGMAGPIMVTKILFSSIKDGAAQFLFALSLISLSLGLFNLFPIPSLDGGHIFLYTIEGMVGHKLPAKVYLWWSYVGAVLLISFMLFMCISDISHLVK